MVDGLCDTPKGLVNLSRHLFLPIIFVAQVSRLQNFRMLKNNNWKTRKKNFSSREFWASKKKSYLNPSWTKVSTTSAAFVSTNISVSNKFGAVISNWDTLEFLISSFTYTTTAWRHDFDYAINADFADWSFGRELKKKIQKSCRI